MKSAPAWVLYTVYRILLFVVPLALLLILRIEPWLSALLAAVIGLCLSYIFLRSPREEVARGLYSATHRTKPVKQADDETEDAAVDLAETRQSNSGDVAADAAEPDRHPANADQASTDQASTDESGAAAAGAGASRSASERERGGEQDAVGEPGEAGEFQGEDKLR